MTGDKVLKSVISPGNADAVADIGLINQYSDEELKPEDVYCFSLVLCDNDIDRDKERFTNSALDAFAPLFRGRPGLFDHNWTAKEQVARLYRVESEDGGRLNSLGEPLRVLRACAYMLDDESSKAIISKIKGGILKEVSVGCSIGKRSCSICDTEFSLNYKTRKYTCENDHERGETYDGKLCFTDLSEPTDAYEFSFVAVPAQRGAGVTKSASDVFAALETLLKSDLGPEHFGLIVELMPKLQTALMKDAERKERQKILDDNEKFLKGDY